MIQSIGPRVNCKPQGEYDATREYVPLDMIRYNNQSFIAKTKVPVNTPPIAGIDSEFWAFWGAYSEEVAEIGEKVNELESYINVNLKKIEMRFVRNSSNLSTINGNCSILKTESNKCYMFDLSYDFNFTNIINSLNDLGITHIDYLLISHYHADHANLSNLTSLYNMGYIDARTIVYAPRTPNGAAWTAELQTIYNDFMTEIGNIGCTVLIPDDNTTLNDENVEITFFNASASDYAHYDAVTSDYNDYSVCNYIKYNNLTIGMLSDIQRYAKEWLASLGVVRRCNIITSPHHGVSAHVAEFDNVINPEYVVIMACCDYLFTDYLTSGLDVSYFAATDSKLLPTNNFAIELNANSLFYDIYDGVVDYLPAGYSMYTIYVDGNYIDEQDGTQSRPFNDLNKAIANAAAMKAGRVEIIVSNYTETNNITITELTDVIIRNCTFTGMVRFRNIAHVELYNCTFGAGNPALRFDYVGYAYVKDCSLTGAGSGIGIISEASFVNIASTSFTNYVRAMTIRSNSSVICESISGACPDFAHIDDSSSNLTMKSTSMTTNSILDIDSMTSVFGAAFKNVNISNMLDSSVTGNAICSTVDGDLIIKFDISNMTLTNTEHTIASLTHDTLLPYVDSFIPIVLVDTGYTTGNYYPGLLHVKTNGDITIVCKDFANCKQLKTTIMYKLHNN